MKKASSLVSVSLLLFAASTLFSEPSCPGNVASVRYHSLGRSQIAIPVTVNGSGPYDFMVDTGSQLTVIDPALASQLRLEPEGSTGLTAVSSSVQTQLVMPESVEAASHSVSRLLVAVGRLGQIQATHPSVRGILGETFLAHFDLLIDYRHKILCIDDGSRLREALRGERIPLLVQEDRQSDIRFPQPYLIPAHLPGSGKQNRLLWLDSGTEVALVYDDFGNSISDSVFSIGDRLTAQATSAVAGKQSFKVLAPEDVTIGNTLLPAIVFVTPLVKSRARHLEDGLLPTALFHRVFLSYAGHFAVLDPK
jgi:hypothetical protein